MPSANNNKRSTGAVPKSKSNANAATSAEQNMDDVGGDDELGSVDPNTNVNVRLYIIYYGLCIDAGIYVIFGGYDSNTLNKPNCLLKRNSDCILHVLHAE